jgi:hypothetical protein
MNISVKWNWNEFCGSPEFSLWNPLYKDIDSCFQYLCLRIPVLCLIAIVSAYYNGLQAYYVRRSKRELWILRVRYCTTLLLSALPVIQTYIEVSLYPGSLYIVQFLSAAIECPSWLIHFAFLMALCHRLGRSLRGPILLGVLWTAHFILSCVNLHSNYVIYKLPPSNLYASKIPLIFSIIHVVLQSIYLLTLLPSETSGLRQRHVSIPVQV